MLMSEDCHLRVIPRSFLLLPPQGHFPTSCDGPLSVQLCFFDILLVVTMPSNSLGHSWNIIMGSHQGLSERERQAGRLTLFQEYQ